MSQAGEKHRVHAGDWGALARGVVRGRPLWHLWNVGPRWGRRGGWREGCRGLLWVTVDEDKAIVSFSCEGMCLGSLL